MGYDEGNYEQLQELGIFDDLDYDDEYDTEEDRQYKDSLLYGD
jgi:hypothetical protein